MPGAGVQVGQALAVLGVAVAGMWTATQWTAAQLGYQARLGEPWFEVSSYPVYAPWRLFSWWLDYEAYAPQVFLRGGLIMVGGVAVAVMVSIVARTAKRRTPASMHGSARWATKAQARMAGLLVARGVLLGRLGADYLRHDGPEHVMLFAPTRTGKAVGVVVPTLLTWPHSVIVHDIKEEHWQLTAGWRSQFSHCLYFNPTDARSAAYNPLLEVRRGVHEVRDVQNIADLLVDPEGALERRNHWEKTSHALLVGAILHVLYAEPDKSLRGVANFLSNPARSIERTLGAMMRTPHLGDRPHPVVAAAAREMLNRSDNERSGVLSTAMSFLGLYHDPVVAEVTSRCDWRIADLVSAQAPVSLYLVVPPSDIERTRPLVRLLLNQIGRRLTETLPQRETPRRRFRWGRRLEAAPDGHPLLWVLDEFPALGRLDFFEQALAFMAGYRMRALLIAQSLNQIEAAYGSNNSILDNCHVRVAFAPNDERTARRLSDTLGMATQEHLHRSYGGSRGALWLDHVNVSRQAIGRPLLTPGEIMQLPPDEELVMVAGHPPLRARKLRYYTDPNFVRRVLPPPALSDGSYADAPPRSVDDWSAMPIPPVPVVEDGIDTDGVGDDGGLQQQEEIAWALRPAPASDLAVLDDEAPATWRDPPRQRGVRQVIGPDGGVPL
ncbi:conjugal transfer protein TraG [Luteimonas marina]|uniref:Conjugal transfer protein TraG n=1 Tax=Luteimonas marina TaxID=488485 RepID=A0A5C5U3U5_9GAMM|nr:IncP-type conjugal transfer protein TraG [Luteimonas marina]TWT20409.1 conjugal transfer protein TraG [Luteimonas marina]